MDELIEADSDNDKVRGKYLWNSVGCRRLLNSCRDEDSALQSSHLSYTWDVYLLRGWATSVS